MPLFICRQCLCVDNTALAKGFWGKINEEGQVVRDKRCTECQTGTWHNKFPKELYDPIKHQVMQESEEWYAENTG